MSDHDIALMERARLAEPEPFPELGDAEELRAVENALATHGARYRLLRERIVSAALVVMAEEGCVPEEFIS